MSPEEENEKDISGDCLKCAACGKKDQTISLKDVGPEPSFLPAMETLMKLRSRDSVLSAFFCPGLVLESGLWGMASIQEPRNSVMMKLAIIAEIGN